MPDGQLVIQRTRPSGREYSAILSLFAMVSHHKELFPMLEKRASAVPGLWDEMKDVEAMTDDILDKILITISPEKLQQIRLELGHVKLYIKIEPPGCVQTIDTSGFAYLPTKTLNQLMCHAMEHECMLCDKTPVEARKCPVRRMFDDALPHEVTAKDTAHCRYSDMSIGMEETDDHQD